MRIDDLMRDELIRLHDIARENGYSGDYMQFKKDLVENPERSIFTGIYSRSISKHRRKVQIEYA